MPIRRDCSTALIMQLLKLQHFLFALLHLSQSQRLNYDQTQTLIPTKPLALSWVVSLFDANDTFLITHFYVLIMFPGDPKWTSPKRLTKTNIQLCINLGNIPAAAMTTFFLAISSISWSSSSSAFSGCPHEMLTIEMASFSMTFFNAVLRSCVSYPMSVKSHVVGIIWN